MSATPQTAADADTETPVEPLAACETAREIEGLSGDVIDQTVVEDGDRVRRTRWEIISRPSEIVNVESGDILIRLGAGRAAEIVDVGDDVSESNGMHVSERVLENDEEPHTTHLRLIRNALNDNRCIIAGTRTEEFANIEGVDPESPDTDRDTVYDAYPRTQITVATVAKHFEAGISETMAEELRDTFGNDLRSLSGALGPQLRRNGFSQDVVSTLFHGEPDHDDQTIAHRHKQENIGPFADQNTLDAFGGGP